MLKEYVFKHMETKTFTITLLIFKLQKILKLQSNCLAFKIKKKKTEFFFVDYFNLFYTNRAHILENYNQTTSDVLDQIKTINRAVSFKNKLLKFKYIKKS